MNLDHLFHQTKTFAELLDGDIEVFLRDRVFKREHLNLEFKREFRCKGPKFDIAEICKYVAGFSNEDGGVVIYGVADSIKDPAVTFPDYVCGLPSQPSFEDISQWITTRVMPLVQSPQLRAFSVARKDILILKVPEGVNRPYAYVEPPANAMTFFKKTAGGVKELRPDEVKDLYWSAILRQSERILKAGVLQGMDVSPPVNDLYTKHRERVIKLLEDPKQFGLVSIYCVPLEAVRIPVDELKKFLEGNRNTFSEVLRFHNFVEPFQNGVSASYVPRAIRKDIKSTARVTLTNTGLVAWDSQADITMDHEGHLQPYWLSYEIQRHLQLAKALLEPYGTTQIRVTVALEHVEHLKIIYAERHGFGRLESEYTGAHEPMERVVALSEINSAFDKDRNVVSPVVRDLMDEISRIFGLDKAPHDLWDAQGKLAYVKGLEGQR